MKPQNVLVFHEERNSFCAKLIDFGYSALSGGLNKRFTLQMSRPWNPPEHDRPQRLWDVFEARNIDFFSFGMLCVWVLFEVSLAELAKISKDIVEEPFDDSSMSGSQAYLSRLKESGELSTFAEEMVARSTEMSQSMKISWKNFFRCSLSGSPNDRKDGMQALFADREPSS